MANNDLFWNQMLMRSDSISDIDASASDAVAQVVAQIATITEQFDRTFDPADQFEEYVAVALCQALQRALTPKIAAPVCKVAVQKAAPASVQTTPPQLPASTQKTKAPKNAQSKSRQRRK
jgi:hypothetical protein